MKRFPARVFLFALIVASGCMNKNQSSAADKTVAVVPVYSESFCSGLDRQPGIIWVEKYEAFQGTWQRIQSHRLGGTSRPLPEIDFADYGVLIISLGEKSTGGYRLELADFNASVDDDQATVYVKRIEPKEGEIVSQVITSPCLMLKIERADYGSIRVLDQSGEIMGEVEL